MLINKLLLNDSGELLLSELWLPQGFWSRLRGLLGRPPLLVSQGMLFTQCRAIHMCFMQQAIDVVFLDNNFVITRLVAGVTPYRFASDTNACHTLELANGAIARFKLAPGQRLIVREA